MQAELSIDGVDDKEEMLLTDVSEWICCVSRLTYLHKSSNHVILSAFFVKKPNFTLQEAFDIMKFTAQEKSELFAVTAGEFDKIKVANSWITSAIMHMGEMKFKQRPREEQAEVEDIQGE